MFLEFTLDAQNRKKYVVKLLSLCSNLAIQCQLLSVSKNKFIKRNHYNNCLSYSELKIKTNKQLNNKLCFKIYLSNI